MKNLFIITLVMTAFAANSIITRLALSSNLIGPSNFALLRAGSAALILVLLVLFIQKKIPKFKIINSYLKLEVQVFQNLLQQVAILIFSHLKVLQEKLLLLNQ